MYARYVRIQRQRSVLMRRLKVPPSINQFTKTLDKSTAASLFKLLERYKPETRQEKKERLEAQAEAQAAGKEVKKKNPTVVKFGINHITQLVEQQKAQLVVIAHDVDPIELVVWLPALCRKMNVPYCIVKGKARLGSVVHQKTSCALAITSIKGEDKQEFSKLVEAVKANFNERYEQNRRQWGGGTLGFKSQQKLRKRAERLRK